MANDLTALTDTLDNGLGALIGPEAAGGPDSGSLKAFLKDVQDTKALLIATQSVLGAMGTAQEGAELGAEIVDTTRDSLKLLGKLGGGLGAVVKKFGSTLGPLESALEKFGELAGNVADNTDVLQEMVSLLIDRITADFEAPLIASIENAERVQDSVGLISNVADSLTTDVDGENPLEGGDPRLLAAAEQLEHFMQSRLASLQSAEDLVRQSAIFEDMTDVFRPIKDSVDEVGASFDRIDQIQDKLGFLERPLDIVNIALSPISGVLDAAGFVFDMVVAPVLNPVLRATGIQGLLDDLAGKLEDLGPDFGALMSYMEGLVGDKALEAIQDGAAFEADDDGSTGGQDNEDGKDYSAEAREFAKFLLGRLAEHVALSDDFTATLDSQVDALRDDTAVSDDDGTFAGDVRMVESFDTETGTHGAVEVVMGDGDDIVIDDAGDAIIDGGAGSDVFIMAGGDDFVTGGTGEDFAVFHGLVGAYTFGATEDGLLQVWNTRPVDGKSYEGTNTFVGVEYFRFGDNQLTELQAFNVQQLAEGEADATGTAGKDVIIGNAGDNVIEGLDGNDVLNGGGAGADRVYGGDGNDLVQVQAGFVLADGGDGIDTLSLAGSNRNWEIDLAENAPDTIRQGSSHWQLTAAIAEALRERLLEEGALTDVNRLDTALQEAETRSLSAWYGSHGGFLRDLVITYQIQVHPDTAVAVFPFEHQIKALFPSTEDFDLAIRDFENVLGGNGDDVLRGTDGDNAIIGNNGNDTLLGLGGNDVLNGGAGNDLIDGGDGEDVLIGLDGNDTFVGSLSADRIDGGDGFDTLSLAHMTGDLSVDMTDGTFNGIDGYQITGIEQVDTGSGNDTIQMANVLGGVSTGAGHDTVITGEGMAGQSIETATGNDTVTARLANQFIYLLGDGDDRLEISGEIGDMQDAHHHSFGGAGRDVLDLGAIAGGVLLTRETGPGFDFGGTVSDSEGASAVLSVSSFEELYLTGSDDSLRGTFADGFKRIETRGGNDVVDLSAQAGNPAGGKPTIDTGDGDDRVSVNSGFSVMIETGDGNDQIDASRGAQVDGVVHDYRSAGGDDIVKAGNAFANIHLGEGLDTVDFSARAYSLYIGLDGINLNGMRDGFNFETNSGIENLIATAADDIVSGNRADNMLKGLDGADTLDGDDGDDLLDGGNGDDFLEGGKGHDVLFGGTGNDEMRGGSGDDTLTGGSGDDLLRGDAGDDYLDGGTGRDTLLGGDGDDRLVMTFEPETVDSYDGGAGSDTVVLTGLGDETAGPAIEFRNFRVDLDAGTATKQMKFGFFGKLGKSLDVDLGTLSGIENIAGSEFRDILLGSGGANVLDGGGGDDEIHGQAGNDVLNGGDGNDVLHGGGGADTLSGGHGDDAVHGGDGDDIFEIALGDDSGSTAYHGGSGNDTFRVSVGTAATAAPLVGEISGDASGAVGQDRVVFDVDLDDLIVSIEGGNVRFRTADGALDLTVHDDVETFEFADQSLSLAEMQAPRPEIVAEYGRFEIGGAHDDFTTIEMQHTYDNPVVIAYIASENGPEFVATRIRNVDGDSFEIALQGQDGADDIHEAETVSYMVVEAGRHELANGAVIEAGTVDTNKVFMSRFEGGYASVDFDGALSGVDTAVFASTNSVNGGEMVTTRIDNVDAGGFRLAMAESESRTDGHVAETIGWVAFEQGDFFDFRTGQVDLDHNAVALEEALDFAQITEINGKDTAIVRQNLSDGTLRIQEDTSHDDEVTHNLDEVSYLIFAEDQGFLFA